VWRCENCGASVQSGTVCPACGRLSDEALNEISLKVRRVRVRRFSADRWLWRRAKTGFAVGSVLSLVLAAMIVVPGLVGDRALSKMGEDLGFCLPFFVGATIFLSILFAVIFLVFGAVVRPIFVALFCSVERFEQEYGPSRK
jgi:hypothetical protein